MQQHIGVRMTECTFGVRNENTAEPELPSLNQFVKIYSLKLVKLLTQAYIPNCIVVPKHVIESLDSFSGSNLFQSKCLTEEHFLRIDDSNNDFFAKVSRHD